MADEYVNEVSDAADLEADQIFLWLLDKSPDTAHHWYRGLLDSYQSLAIFPYRNPEIENLPGVRRMLFGKYRVLYRVVEPAIENDYPTVRIMHVYHGARQPG